MVDDQSSSIINHQSSIVITIGITILLILIFNRFVHSAGPGNLELRDDLDVWDVWDLLDVEDVQVVFDFLII